MAFSNIILYGGCDVDYFWCRTEEVSDDVLNEMITSPLYTPTWDASTVLLANFDDSLDAGDISGDITRYVIHRKIESDDTLYKVADLDASDTQIKDFNTGSRRNYVYYITPVYENEDGEEIYGSPIESDTIKTNFDAWSVVSLIPTREKDIYTVNADEVWTFYINTESGSFGLNNDKSVTSGLGKFPKAYTGVSDYLSGSLSCYIGHINCICAYIEDDIEKLEKWREFCNDGHMKLLRDPKGHIIPCEITDVTYTSDYTFAELPTTLNFNFTQIDDTKNIEAYTTDF